MTQSNVSQQLTQSFDNTSPSASSTPCCKEVKGHWENLRLVPSKPQLVGELESKEVNPDGGILEKGIKFTQRVKLSGKVSGRLVCTCADDGRTLSAKDEERTVPPVTVPLSYTFKAVKLPFLAPLQFMKQLKELDEIVNAAAGGDPNASAALKELGGEAFMKALKEMRDSADNICKNKHKCSGDSKTEPTS